MPEPPCACNVPWQRAKRCRCISSDRRHTEPDQGRQADECASTRNRVEHVRGEAGSDQYQQFHLRTSCSCLPCTGADWSTNWPGTGGLDAAGRRDAETAGACRTACSLRAPPAERRLSHQIGCSRETLRRALSDLQHAGRIWRHVGQGTFCGPAPRNLPIRETLLIDGATPSDLLRARLALEPQITAEAARKAKPADIKELKRLVERGCTTADRS